MRGVGWGGPVVKSAQQHGDGRRRGNGNNWRGGEANKKNAQEMSFDVSWAVGKFFLYSLFMFSLLTLFRYLLELLTTKATKYPPPSLRATARGVGTGDTPKKRDNGNAITRPNGTTMERQGDGRRWVGGGAVKGNKREEAKQTKKGPRDVRRRLLGRW